MFSLTLALTPNLKTEYRNQGRKKESVLGLRVGNRAGNNKIRVVYWRKGKRRALRREEKDIRKERRGENTRKDGLESLKD